MAPALAISEKDHESLPAGIRTPASESLFHAEVRKAADEKTSGTVRKAVVGASSGATANTISMTPPRWIAMALMARIGRRDVSSFRLSQRRPTMRNGLQVVGASCRCER
jgi:hypothetical protein